MTAVLLWCLAAAVAGGVCVWLLSLLVGRVCIVDAFWGPGFGLVAATAMFHVPESARGWPEWLLLVLVLIWGLRLGLHLSIRIIRAGEEDRRYAAMRRKYDPNFHLKSLGIVFLLQAVILWFVSMPVTTGIASADAPGAGWQQVIAAAGVLLWAAGVFFEAVGDWQLARFRANPANAGLVLDSGLWAFTRHPNYFGDFCVWWGLWLTSLAAGAPLWTAAAPAVMAFFLIKVSGVPMLEGDISSRRPGYAEYIRRTNAFFPGWPKSVKPNEKGLQQ
jgi:steroid 5-alpha reductase family enzyme